MASTIRTRAAHSGFYERMALAVDGWSERTAKRRLYRQTYRELASMSSRELSDLGLNRSSLGAVAYDVAYGPK